MIEEIDEILFKSISGKILSAKEEQTLKDWIGRSKKNETIYDRFKEYWEVKKFGGHDITDRAWSKLETIVEKDHGSEVKTSKENTKGKNNSNWGFIYTVAASIILLVGYFIYWQQPYNNLQNDQGPEIAQIVIKSRKGEKRTIKLPDGSAVKLNADSKLTFPSVFSSVDREVILEGEAFFDVQKYENRPFKVLTKDIVTTVKGTSFNIRAFKDEEKISVSVLTGNVEVTNVITQQNIDLQPNEAGTYSLEEEKLNKSIADKDCFIWKDGVLKFDKAAFEQVVKDLENWYGVEFIIKNGPDLNKNDFSGEFKNESLAAVMEAMAYSGNFEFEIIDKLVIIK